jgi:thymidylate synthase ThyX
MLSLQAQPLTPHLGYDVPGEIVDAGCDAEYVATQEACADLARRLGEMFPHEASYAVTLAHRIRFTMTLNAREAMHLIELRSQPQGHETYRHVAREMHRSIADEAGHRALAAMMRFVDRSSQAAGRLGAERRQEERAAARNAR